MEVGLVGVHGQVVLQLVVVDSMNGQEVAVIQLHLTAVMNALVTPSKVTTAILMLAQVRQNYFYFSSQNCEKGINRNYSVV